ncbi:MAG TPA: hypothetical protein VLG47_07380 [Candidatus Saccharimonadales bacterium]|nr:hypothetical protein [Candidatus Saccharimonadales bacterium]
MRYLPAKISATAITLLLIVASLLVGAGSFFAPKVAASYLGARSLELSDSRAGQANVNYNFSYSVTTGGTVGSVEFQFCSNSTFPTDPCTAPVGMDASAAVLTAQTGMAGFSIQSATANDIILTRIPAATAPVTATATFDTITNPTNEGSYYGRIITYATNNATGPSTDHGGVAFAILASATVQVTVPPYLLFCVGITINSTDCNTATGDFVDMGDFSTSITSSGQSQMVAATNGQNGYNITVHGTTMQSGNNLIPAITGNSPALPGTSQFGINLRDNSNPNIGANPSGAGVANPTANYNITNQYRYNDGEAIVSSSVPDDLRKYTVSYIVDVGSSQAVGIYASTYTYVALANF